LLLENIKNLFKIFGILNKIFYFCNRFDEISIVIERLKHKLFEKLNNKDDLFSIKISRIFNNIK